jgi:hypothetical protein
MCDDVLGQHSHGEDDEASVGNDTSSRNELQNGLPASNILGAGKERALVLHEEVESTEADVYMYKVSSSIS